MQILAIMLGGMLGALARFGTGSLIQKLAGSAFPYGTLTVNVTGSLLIGLLWGFSNHFHFPPVLRTFLFIGFLGSFTTFSSFSLETMGMIQKGQIAPAFLYIILQNVLGISAAFLGYLVSTRMV